MLGHTYFITIGIDQRSYMTARPKIALIGRFTESATAIRSHGVVSSRRLLESIWNAGGDPITFLPVAGPNWEERLAGFSGVLMAGGGDVDPKRYGQSVTAAELYGVDELQDENDFSVAEFALERGIPLLAICRGFQVVNVLRGGTLVQHMAQPHTNHVSNLTISSGVSDLGLSKATLETSCFHHQAVDKLGEGLEVLASAPEGHVEAFRILAKAWSFGVQWHPEDNYKTDAQQAELFAKFLDEARQVSYSPQQK
jgi:putative glutamine amidotransferase